MKITHKAFMALLQKTSMLFAVFLTSTLVTGTSTLLAQSSNYPGSPCPYCGSGEVYGGEFCEGPTCGDGVVNNETEQCDLGEGNSDTQPDTCRTNCLLPKCGDGITDPGRGEECDGSANCTVDCKIVRPTNPCSSISTSEITHQFRCSGGIVAGYASVSNRINAWIAVPTKGEKYPDGKNVIVKTWSMFGNNTGAKFKLQSGQKDAFGNQLATSYAPIYNASGVVTGEFGPFDASICYSESALRCGDSFDPEAELALADGSQKKVKDLSVEDKLLSPDGKAVGIKSIVQSTETFALFEIKAGTYSVRVTRNHPVWTASGLVLAHKLKAGDTVKVQDGSLLAVDSVKELPVAFNQDAYGITVDVPEGAGSDASLVFGGGIVLGDLRLEEALTKDAK